ncbi:MAG: hypothetical protein ACU85U_05730 [Gammaproteobacteria bacterium]
MTNRITPVLDGVRDSTARTDQTAERAVPFIESWYGRGAGTLWSVSNVAAALCVAGISFGYLPVSVLAAPVLPIPRAIIPAVTALLVAVTAIGVFSIRRGA